MKAYYYGLGLTALIVLIGTVFYALEFEGDPVYEPEDTLDDFDDPDLEALVPFGDIPEIDWADHDGTLLGGVDDSLSGLPGTDLLQIRKKEIDGFSYYRVDIAGGPSDEVGYELFFQGETVIQGRIVPPDRVYFWNEGDPYSPENIAFSIDHEGFVIGVGFPHESVSVAVFSFRTFRETGSSEDSYDLFQFDGTLG